MVHRMRTCRWQVDLGRNMVSVSTRQEYAAALAHCKEKYPLVVVDFFAPWCSGCRALYPKLRQIASANLDVAFIKVSSSCQSLTGPLARPGNC